MWKKEKSGKWERGKREIGKGNEDIKKREMQKGETGNW